MGGNAGLAWTLSLVFAIGAFTYALNRRVQISTVPVLLLLGVLVGPILGLLALDDARGMFDQLRVIGLVIILFTAGFSLQWPVLHRHLRAIVLLDTVGLLLTSAAAGWLFCYLFEAPAVIGLLFGALVAATDPATLIPLFKETPLERSVETVLITESIFNDPLSIVLTTVAIALLVPQADSAWLLGQFSDYLGLYPAAVAFFLYTLGASMAIGIALGWGSHRAAMHLNQGQVPVLFGLSVAFGGYVLAEWLHASGFLAATTIGIVVGNHHWFFNETDRQNRRLERFLSTSVGFEEPLADFAAIFIFVLLGASLDLSQFSGNLWPQLGLALALVLLLRPAVVVSLLGLFGGGRWTLKQMLFIGLEGPRGIVPAALAGLPLSLGIHYHNPELIHWGGLLLTSTLISIFVSVILCTSWMGRLGRSLGVIHGPDLSRSGNRAPKP